MKRSLPALAALALLFLLPAAASGSGGDSIAAAPELPIGQQQFNNPEHNDYWRITLNAGDALRLDYGRTGQELTGGYSLAVCLLRPSVTDYTLQDAPCIAYSTTDKKTQLRFVANPSGRFTLAVGMSSCLLDHVYCLPGNGLAYELTAYVQRYTSTALSAPPAARVGKKLKLTGHVTAATTGHVEIGRRSGRIWRLLGLANIRTNGSFTYTTKLKKAGVVRLRALYRGDSSHRASSAAVAVRVY